MELLFSSSKYILPLVPVIFMLVIFLIKLYRRIRSCFKFTVNCWFCNRNTKVLHEQKNRWTCPNCEQYNGFSQDGDYNCEIAGQRAAPREMGQISAYSYKLDRYTEPTNGLCTSCNDKQTQKIDKLAQFEPENDKYFDTELADYDKMLEDMYKPCRNCEVKITKILSEKKKVILGAKLTQMRTKDDSGKSFHLMGAIDKLKISNGRCEEMKRAAGVALFAMALVNFLHIIFTLDVRRSKLEAEWGTSLPARMGFNIITHFVAFSRTLVTSLLRIFEIEIVEKTALYIRSIAKLLVFSFGWRVPKNPYFLSMIHSNGFNCGNIMLSFFMNLFEGFKITRYLLLMTLWSCIGAAGSSAEPNIFTSDVFNVISSIAILIFSIPSMNTANLARDCLETTHNSFHRIYCDDYLNSEVADLSNESLMSRSSTSSVQARSQSSQFNTSILNKTRSPSKSMRNRYSSSLYDLNRSPASEFKKYNGEEQSHFNQKRGSALKSCSQGNTSRMLFSSDMEQQLNSVPSVISLSSSFTEKNILNSTFTKPTRNPTKTGFRLNGPSSPSLSYFSGVSQKPSVLSPSRFRQGINRNVEIFSTTCNRKLLKIPQSGTNIHKSLINLTTVNEAGLSRGSSQSSGFESHASSTVPGDNEFSFIHPTSGYQDSFDNQYSSQELEPPSRFQKELTISCPSPSLSTASLFSSEQQQSLNHRALSLQPPVSRQSKIFSPEIKQRRTADFNYQNDQTLNWSHSESRTASISSPKNSINIFEFNAMENYLPSVQSGGLFKDFKNQTRNY